MKVNNDKLSDIEAIIHGLERTPGMLATLISSIPKDILKKRRNKDKWSIHELACHIVDVQPMLIQRFKKFKNEEHPVFKPYLPGKTVSKDHLLDLDLEAMLSKFKKYREELVGLVRGFSTEEWDKSGSHDEYEEYTPHILLRHVLMHDYFHMYRIEELWLTRDEYLPGK